MFWDSVLVPSYTSRFKKENTELKYATHTLPQNTSNKPIYAEQPQRN